MKDLTKGYPAKVILFFTLPLIIGNIAQNLYNITDSKIVSLFVGTSALAAVGATGSITNLFVGFLNGLTQGFAIVTARQFGAKNDEKIRRAVAGTFIMVGVFSVLMTVLAMFSIRPLLEVLQTPPEVIDDSVAYLRIIVCGIVFTAIYNMSANTLRAVGDSKRPLYCLFVAIVINIILDILFTGVFKWGIKGAALATILSQAVSAFSSFGILVIRTKEIVPFKQDYKLTMEEYKEMLNFGFAMGMMGSLVTIGSVILQGAINGLGETILAAHTGARRILDIMMVMVYTIGLSMTTYVSQNFGAGKIDRIRQGVKHAIITVTIITTVLIIVCFLFDRALVQWITSSSLPEIVDNGELYLKIGVVCFYVLGPLFIYRCSLQGMGSKSVPLLTSALELLIKIISAWLLVPALGYLGVAMTEPISWFVMTGVLWVGYRLQIKRVTKEFDKKTKKA